MNVSDTTPISLPPLGSATPGLEGAPRSVSHEDRIKSVISLPSQGETAGKGDALSKP